MKVRGGSIKIDEKFYQDDSDRCVPGYKQRRISTSNKMRSKNAIWFVCMPMKIWYRRDRFLHQKTACITEVCQTIHFTLCRICSAFICGPLGGSCTARPTRDKPKWFKRKCILRNLIAVIFGLLNGEDFFQIFCDSNDFIDSATECDRVQHEFWCWSILLCSFLNCTWIEAHRRDQSSITAKSTRIL